MTWTHVLLGLLVLLVFLHVLLVIKHAKLQIRNADLERRLLSYRLSYTKKEE